MLDPVSLLVIVDDLDMIPSGHWIKVRMAKAAPEPVVEVALPEPMPVKPRGKGGKK